MIINFFLCFQTFEQLLPYITGKISSQTTTTYVTDKVEMKQIFEKKVSKTQNFIIKKCNELDSNHTKANDYEVNHRNICAVLDKLRRVPIASVYYREPLNVPSETSQKQAYTDY